MQVSATLIAAQQARAARTRLQLPQPAQEAPKANFAAALEKTTGTGGGFSPLTLRQTAAPQSAAPEQHQASGRMGQHVNIVV